MSEIIGTTPINPKNPSDSRYAPRRSWNISYNESNNPINEGDSSDEFETIKTIPKPNSPSDSSDSDDSGSERGGGPPKPSPKTPKDFSTAPVGSQNRSDTYRFDMKLKPETIPIWDGNEDMLARWLEKVGQLANISPSIFRELGKIVPRRFTDSAETWY